MSLRPAAMLADPTAAKPCPASTRPRDRGQVGEGAIEQMAVGFAGAVARFSDRLSRGPWLAVLVVIALSMSFAIGPLLHPSALGPPAGPIPDRSTAGYASQVVALLARSEASMARLDDVLAERDRNPALTGSVAWQQRYARVVSELQDEYQAARALTPPSGEVEIQTCLGEGLRLTSTGAAMLHDAFLTGGHGAYYLSAHGNWDLHLGVEQLQRCRALLAQTAVAPGSGG